MKMKMVKGCIALALSFSLAAGDTVPLLAAEIQQTEQPVEAEADTEETLFTSDYSSADAQQDVAEAAVDTADDTENLTGAGGRTVDYYSLQSDGGNWTGTRYYKPDGEMAKDVFFFDGSYTYYLRAMVRRCATA